MRSRRGGACSAARYGARRRRRGVRIARHRPVGDVEQRRGVAHRAGDDELGREAVPALAGGGAERVAAARRLEADEAAVRGGDADRAAAVAGVRRRHDAGRHRRRRAAARPAGAVRWLPGIAGGAEGVGLGGRQQAELGRVGASEDDQAGGEELVGDVGVARARSSWRPSGSACRRCSAARLRGRRGPSSGTARRGRARAADSPPARSRAGSRAGRVTALSCGLRRSQRAIAASTSSRGVSSRRRTNSAWAVASRKAISSSMPALRAQTARAEKGAGRPVIRESQAGSDRVR